MLTRRGIVIGLALLIGMGGVLGAIRIASMDGPAGPSAASPSSSVIEPADADPLPVVGPSDPLVSSVPEDSVPGDIGRSDSMIQVPRGDATSGANGFLAAAGLDDATTTADGYRFVDAGLNRAALVAILARKFGIEGQPRRAEDGAWIVTPPRRSLPRVRVDAGPMVEWAYAWLPQPTMPSPTPPVPSTSQVPAIDGPSPEAVTRAFLGDLGVPIDELDWQVEVIGGSTIVTGWQVIAGQRTQAGWRMAFGADGQVTEASGFAATPVDMPDLPVLGAGAALARARQPQWSALGPTLLAPAPRPEGANSTSTSRPVGPSKATLAEDLDQRVILSAELGLAQFTQPDGRLLVLPAYVLTADDGSTWSLVAVADGALSLVSR